MQAASQLLYCRFTTGSGKEMTGFGEEITRQMGVERNIAPSAPPLNMGTEL
jgi:hypothetical protein